MRTTEQIAAALADANVLAFLRVIRAGETNQTPDAYRMLFGGDLVSDLSGHPRKSVTRGTLTSTAAGAYQFLARTWDECAAAMRLPDFSPRSQDLAAVFLIERRRALDAVIAGDIPRAIDLCNREWASLPGSPYGQPTRTMEQALAVYAQYGGTRSAAALPPIADSAMSDALSEPQKERKSMFPGFLTALLPVLTSAIPELVKLIKPDSDAANKNAEIAAKTFAIAQQALGAVNAQEVAERIQSDPQAAQTVRDAVQARWFELAEVGGGIQAARQADIEVVEKIGGFWRSPSFAAMFFLAPLVYLIVGSVSGLWGYNGWSDDVRAAIATAVVSTVIGGATGFYWGSTTSRNKPQQP